MLIAVALFDEPKRRKRIVREIREVLGNRRYVAGVDAERIRRIADYARGLRPAGARVGARLVVEELVRITEVRKDGIRIVRRSFRVIDLPRYAGVAEFLENRHLTLLR